MKKSHLNNLILEAYAEVLKELNEAPDGMSYFEVAVRDAKKAIGIMHDRYDNQFEMNGSNVYYFTDESTAYDAMMDLGALGIEIIDSNLDEADDKDDYGRPHVDPKGSRTYIEPEDMLPHNRFKDLMKESLLDDLSEDEEEPTPEEEPDEDAGPETVLEDATDTILSKFPTVKQAVVKLQTEDFKEFVDSIDWISPRPTSFRVNLKNGQDYILKWTGKTFEAQILGKKYLLSNISDYQQAIDKLALLYKEAPMKGAGEEDIAADTDTGGGGGGGGDFPGEEGGAEGGEDLGGDDAGGDLGGDEGGEDLSDEPIDFESGEEG